MRPPIRKPWIPKRETRFCGRSRGRAAGWTQSSPARRRRSTNSRPPRLSPSAVRFLMPLAFWSPRFVAAVADGASNALVLPRARPIGERLSQGHKDSGSLFIAACIIAAQARVSKSSTCLAIVRHSRAISAKTAYGPMRALVCLTRHKIRNPKADICVKLRRQNAVQI
jgi:hypothetical protein